MVFSRITGSHPAGSVPCREWISRSRGRPYKKISRRVLYPIPDLLGAGKPVRSRPVRRYLAYLLFLFITCPSPAQVEYTPADKSWPSLKVHGYAQIWGRYSQMNPGSRIGENPVDDVWDISVRRYRFGIRGRISEQFDYYLVVGNNNFNTRESSLEITLLDLFSNYHFADWGTLTAGKTVLTGLSRYAGPSASNAFGLDVNFASNPYLNNHDQRFRKFSVGVHGLLDRLQYKLVLAKPNFRDEVGPLGPEAVWYSHPR